MGFAEAVMMGLATDGGLLLPEQIPVIAPEQLRQWTGLSFTDLAVEVLWPYVHEALTRDTLQELVRRSYAGFTHPDITPVVAVGGRRILELFHGPTAAFKDVALQWLGNLFEYFLQRGGGQLNIVGATSGDTGSAAIYGVRGKQRIQIFILHPHGRVSPIQERQMTTVLDANVHNLAIEGTFDDGQRIVKELFNDLEFKHHYQLGAVNSINWARVLAQVVYYFYAWGRVGGDLAKPLAFAVPTGNFGDIFAGYVARRMGLPIGRLILATNRNDILTRFVETGAYTLGEVQPTVSPSMDIQVASNFERYLFYVLKQDSGAVRELMVQLGRDGGFSLSASCMEQVRADFSAVAVSEAATLEQIRATYQATGYILDPHTAVGVRAAADDPAAICLATAHPAKFGEAVQQAIGRAAPEPASLQGLLERETRCVRLPAESGAVKQWIINTLAGGV